MAPLASLDGDRLRKVRVVVSDVDDTLTRDGRLELEAYEALWALRDAHVPVVIVTGRPLGWAELMARQWPIALAIGENGAGWIAAEGDAPKREYWDPPALRAERTAALEALRQRVAEALPRARVSDDDDARRCDLAWDVAEHHHLAVEEVEALGALVREAGMRFVVSSVHAHAVPGDWDKARGAARAIREHLSVDPLRDGIFVGDSANDAEAFARFELSVGVANVRRYLPKLSKPPAFVTEGDRGRGFAEVCRALLTARAG